MSARLDLLLLLAAWPDDAARAVQDDLCKSAGLESANP
jgi:hypothetical protein